MLAAATILALAASKPAAPVSDVVKLRIKLIDLYCSTDPPSPVHSTASERAAAAKKKAERKTKVKSKRQLKPYDTYDEPLLGEVDSDTSYWTDPDEKF